MHLDYARVWYVTHLQNVWLCAATLDKTLCLLF
jgi:hypothetical protein